MPTFKRVKKLQTNTQLRKRKKNWRGKIKMSFKKPSLGTTGRNKF